ncbi:hypothetical protein MKX01_014281 [Papaver californicum]|nr:hypothetical protein MKX01_014281 [Papaver californicum]
MASLTFAKTLGRKTSSLARTLSPITSRLQIRSSMSTSVTPNFKKVQIQRNDLSFDAYVVGKEDAPGIVVLQEWWGVDFEIKNHAVKISQLGSGYKSLIPDLYRGKDISASVNWLKANGSKKAGVTGYCMSGALSIASGVLIPEVDAVVAFYGVPPQELAHPTQTRAPVQAHILVNLITLLAFQTSRQQKHWKKN